MSATPPHVPAHLVRDFDYLAPAGMNDGDDVYQAWSRLHDGPDIFWTPHYGGHWVLTRAEDIQAVQKDFARFSHKEFTLPRGLRSLRLVPLEVDPPEHGAYRSVINPFFTPRAVGELEAGARTLAIEIIERLRPQGGCEFVGDFARVMPVVVFLGMMDLPSERRAEFLSWAEQHRYSATVEGKREAFGKIQDYLKSIIRDRELVRGKDIISRILDTRGEGKRLQHPDDVIGMVTLLFLGGLDTVASMLAFTARFLAKNPGHRQRLIDFPDIIPKAAEEFTRRYGLSNTIRIVTDDTTYKDVFMKRDDAVMVPIGMSGMDDRRYGNAQEVDFDRVLNPHEHDTFGNGPHRCPGAPLARTELRIFLEEWLKRIPDFAIDPVNPDVTVSSAVNSVESLHLVWPTSH